MALQVHTTDANAYLYLLFRWRTLGRSCFRTATAVATLLTLCVLFTDQILSLMYLVTNPQSSYSHLL